MSPHTNPNTSKQIPAPVFCEDCHWRQELVSVERCLHPEALHLRMTAERPLVTYDRTAIRNPDNQCPDFEPMTLWELCKRHPQTMAQGIIVVLVLTSGLFYLLKVLWR